MAALWFWIKGSWLGRAVAVAVGLGVALLWAFRSGKRTARRDDALRAHQGASNGRPAACEVYAEFSRGLIGPDVAATPRGVKERVLTLDAAMRKSCGG